MNKNKGFFDYNINEKVIQSLKKDIETDSIKHGYIFEGPINSNKFILAKSFIMAVFCANEKGVGCGKCGTCKKILAENYVDITILKKEKAKSSTKESIKNEQIKDMQQRLINKPFEGNRNVAIIKDGQTVTYSGFNTLLKTLEEPPVGTIIIILVENSQLIPETIRSRCVKYFLSDTIDKKRGKNEKNKETVSEIAELLVNKAPYYKSKNLLEKFIKNPEDGLYFLDELEGIVRNVALNEESAIYREWAIVSIFKIERARKEIQSDASTANTLKKLILDIGG